MAGLLPPAERRASLLTALYAAFSLILLLVGDRVPQTGLRGMGAALFAPFDRVVLGFDRMAAAWREHESVHTRLAELELENQRLRTLGIENAVLRDQLGLPGREPVSLRPVEVLALAGEPLPAFATLSAGRDQGLRVGDAVVTREGLVGRVIEVYGSQSRAALITDPQSAVACEVESTGVLGILRFTATPRPALRLTSVPFADTVRVGEQVLSSGLSRRYPRGVPVGRVTRVGHDESGLTQSIELAPAARLSRLRHVFVVPGPGPLQGEP